MSQQDETNQRFGRRDLKQDLSDAIKTSSIKTIIDEVNLNIDSADAFKDLTTMAGGIDNLNTNIISLKEATISQTGELREGKIVQALATINTTLVDKLQGASVGLLPMGGGTSGNVDGGSANSAARTSRKGQRDAGQG